MIRNLMLPLDGSPEGEQALPWALHLARAARATVHAVCVSFPPPAFVGTDGLTIGDPSLYQTLQQLEQDYLNKVTAQATSSETTVTSTLIDADDSAASCLAHFAATHDIDLTVMTTHGRGPFARFWIGSVADEFLRCSHGLTLLVRVNPTTLPTAPDIRHVLIPLDGSDLADQILKPAIAVGTLFQADFTLLLVLDGVNDIRGLVAKATGTTTNLFPPASAIHTAKEYLDRQAAPLRHAGHTVHTHVIEHGEVSEIILKESSDPGTLIALATHGQGGLSRMLWGSVADKVIHGATGPVLIIRPKESE